ncbi:DUF6351 family protein [Streptomyces sp. M19]
MASTTTADGVKVPYIVRMETGSRNRGVYETAVLHDPLKEPTPDAHTRPAGWNGRAVYTLGGGCIGGWYRQGSTTGGVTDPFLLGQGYALMSSTLNVFGNNCSDLTAAETAMMVKERFVETYGPPRHTIGLGCSGGSYQALQIVDNYPGILDGIIPACSFPDVGFAMTSRVTDTRLLTEYFADRTDLTWTERQKGAVTGFGSYATATATTGDARRIDPMGDCGALPRRSGTTRRPIRAARAATCTTTR